MTRGLSVRYSQVLLYTEFWVFGESRLQARTDGYNESLQDNEFWGELP
jgi:hypothetical protein